MPAQRRCLCVWCTYEWECVNKKITNKGRMNEKKEKNSEARKMNFLPPNEWVHTHTHTHRKTFHCPIFYIWKCDYHKSLSWVFWKSRVKKKWRKIWRNVFQVVHTQIHTHTKLTLLYFYHVKVYCGKFSLTKF